MITARPPVPAWRGEPLDAAPTARAVASRYAAGAFAVAVVAAVDPAGLAPFGPARWAVVSSGACVLGSVALARRRSMRTARVPTLLFAALIGSTAVAAALGLDPLYAWTGTPERHAGVLAWALCGLAFLVGQSLRAEDLRVTAPAFAVAAVVAGGWATAEALGWEPFRLVGVTDRPGGPFGSSSYLGAAAALLGAPAVGLALDAARRGAVRALGAGGGVLAGVALVASGARAAWAGAVLVAITVVLVRRRLRVTLALGGIVVAAVALALALGVASRGPDLVRDERGGIQGRLDEWRVATRVIADNPVLGVGPEGYRIAFAEHVDPAYEQAHGRDPLPDRAHAALLDVAATTGIPGAALFAALLATVAAFLLRALRRSDLWTAGAAAGVLAYFSQSLVLFPVPELDVLAWLLAGMVVARTARIEETKRWRRHPWAAAALAVAAVIFAVAGVLDVVADRAVKRTLDGPVAAQPDRAARLRPDALRYHLAAARAVEATDVDAALGHLADARRLSPRDPVVAREHARLLLDRARRTERNDHTDVARATLEALVRRDPHNAEAQLRLGLARALDGDDRGAERAWLAAERLAPRSAAAPANLAVAYARAGRIDDARRAAHRALARDPHEERARQVLRVIGDEDGT